MKTQVWLDLCVCQLCVCKKLCGNISIKGKLASARKTVGDKGCCGPYCMVVLCVLVTGKVCCATRSGLPAL